MVAAAPRPNHQPGSSGQLLVEFAGWRGVLSTDSDVLFAELRDAFGAHARELRACNGTTVIPACSVSVLVGRDRAPELRAFRCGACVPSSLLLTGPDWRRIATAPGGEGYCIDSVLGGPPVLQRCGDHLRILRSDLASLIVSWVAIWLMLEERALFALHAAVAASHGCALVLVGPSGAGKSTLVRALHDEGADVYSDEVAFFRCHDLAVHAIRAPIALRPGGIAALGCPAPTSLPQEKRPGDLKWQVTLPVPTVECPSDRAMIVLLDPFAPEPKFARSGGGEAARRLLRHVACGDPSVAGRLAFAARLATQYPVVNVAPGPPHDTARTVLRRLADLA